MAMLGENRVAEQPRIGLERASLYHIELVKLA
jgi:hypothetical protein